MRDLSVSSPRSKDPNTPRKVGDKGPHKNYRRKVAKKAKALPEEGGKVAGDNGSGLGSLLMGMKHMETEEGITGEGGTDTPDLMYDFSLISRPIFEWS